MASPWRSFCETAHLTALGLWAGSIAMAAATAAVAFPTLKNLDVKVPGLAPGTEPAEYRFAAGAVAQKVFLISDTVAFFCALIAGATLLALLLMRAIPPRQPASILRAIAYGIALASLASILLIITPRINTAARLHLDAARSGDAAASARHKQEVDDLHPMSRNLLVAEFAGVLLSLLAGAWSLAASATPTATAPASPYPEPALARRARTRP